jgi:hypothetical protein
MCSCPDDSDDVLEIDIGDYEAQLAAWNSKNMIDYKLSVELWNMGIAKAVVIVKNGVPETSDFSLWFPEWQLPLTIQEYYSYIEKEVKNMRSRPKNEYESASFKVRYNTEYHYPNYIFSCFSYGSSDGAWNYYEWRISLTPLGEEE